MNTKNKPTIIAEVKTVSPFGFKSTKTWDELFAIAEKFGDIISIHTDSRWGGSFDLLKKARALTRKPILAKGIHGSDTDIVKAIELGADFVLVVGRVPAVKESNPQATLSEDDLEKCLIEPNALVELSTIPESLKVVWNSRDLSSGGMKSEIFADARKLRKGWLCQASNIKTIADIEPGADAVLVGENLERFIESLQNDHKSKKY